MTWLLWPIISVIFILASIPVVYCRAWTFFPEDMDARSARSVAKKLGLDAWGWSTADSLRAEYVGGRLAVSVLVFIAWPISFPFLVACFCGTWLFCFLARSGKSCAIRKAQK